MQKNKTDEIKPSKVLATVFSFIVIAGVVFGIVSLKNFLESKRKKKQKILILRLKS
jgi:large-conductance mechanosensitive channel